MRGYIANTDKDWFDFLAAQSGLEELNFWQPSGGRSAPSCARPHFSLRERARDEDIAPQVGLADRVLAIHARSFRTDTSAGGLHSSA